MAETCRRAAWYRGPVQRWGIAAWILVAPAALALGCARPPAAGPDASVTAEPVDSTWLAPADPSRDALARALTATTGLDIVSTASSAVCIAGEGCALCARACALVVHAEVDLLAVAARVPAAGPGYVTGIRGEEPRELSALIPAAVVDGRRSCPGTKTLRDRWLRLFPDLSAVPRGERAFEVESIGFLRCGAVGAIARRIVTGTTTRPLTDVGPVRCTLRAGAHWVEEVP